MSDWVRKAVDDHDLRDLLRTSSTDSTHVIELDCPGHLCKSPFIANYHIVIIETIMVYVTCVCVCNELETNSLVCVCVCDNVHVYVMFLDLCSQS